MTESLETENDYPNTDVSRTLFGIVKNDRKPTKICFHGKSGKWCRSAHAFCMHIKQYWME